jgi:hypothetical protein
MAAVSDNIVLWHALYSLEARYWHEVDTNGGANAHTFYTADGLLAVGDNEFRGRERFKSHRLRPVFMGAEVPLSMAVDLTR